MTELRKLAKQVLKLCDVADESKAELDRLRDALDDAAKQFFHIRGLGQVEGTADDAFIRILKTAASKGLSDVQAALKPKA
jgi:hypothetical protein